MFPSTGAKSKPILDEAGFQQLLAAAYVLQQHNDSLRVKDPRLDTAWIFSQIAETQALVRAGSLNFTSGIKVIADRLRTVTGAGGVSICLLTDGCLECAAESGTAVTTPGGSVAANSVVATERLKNGRQFHSSDAQKDIRLNLAPRHAEGIASLLAVPIQASEEIAGLVELRWSKPDAFHECDLRTSQLMAGLVSELLQRETVPKARSASGEQFHFINPMTGAPTEGVATIDEQLRVDEDLANLEVSVPDELPLDLCSEISDLPPACEEPASLASAALASHCRVCGRPFGMDEAFCGNCSMPRIAATPAEGLQSKWASMWFMQQAQETLQEPSLGSLPEQEFEQVFPHRVSREEAKPPEQSTRQKDPVSSHRIHAEAATVGVRPAQRKTGTTYGRATRENEIASGTGADADRPESERRDLSFRALVLRVLASSRNKAVAIAASVLLLVLISIWGLSPTASPTQLTWFESLLVELGLAEAPARTPGYAGSPNVQVWVDVHTALYYCPGSGLYGKTPGGHFTTQRDAQQDGFEPATRVACE